MNREIADDIVKELINLGADDTLADSHKETAYLFAARNSPEKLQVSLFLPPAFLCEIKIRPTYTGYDVH